MAWSAWDSSRSRCCSPGPIMARPKLAVGWIRLCPVIDLDGPQQPQHAVGKLGGLPFVGVRQQQRELLAADAGGDVGFTHPVPQQLADPAQHRVAGFVAVGVVDHLEVIQIEHQDGQGGLAPACLLEHLAAQLEERAPVVQSGQFILQGCSPGLGVRGLERQLHFLAFGDVGGDFHPHQPAVGPADGPVPALVPAFVQNVLELPDVGGRGSPSAPTSLELVQKLHGPSLPWSTCQHFCPCRSPQILRP